MSLMRSRDSLLLALTKLRLRRVRLIITLFIMSLLFTGLVTASIVAGGVFHSLASFSKEGLGSRFIVAATPQVYGPYDNPALNASLQKTQQDLITRKTALAKKLGVPYDAKSDQALPLQQGGPGPAGSSNQQANFSSPIVLDALARQNHDLGSTSYPDFVMRSRQAGAQSTYQSTQPNYGSGASNVQVLVNGKEDYSLGSPSNTPAPTSGLQTITSLGWSQMSEGLLRPFLLPGQSASVGPDGSIPVIAPSSAAEQLLGLSPLHSTATAQQKLERLETLRSQAAGKQAVICYRNAASRDLLQKAISQQADIAAGKKDKTYTPPALQYNLPATACGPVTIKQDKRSAEEKTADASQAKFDAAFATDTTPVQGTFTLRIAGLTSDANNGGNGFDAGSLLSGIFGSTIGSSWLSPIGSVAHNDLATRAQGGALADQPVGLLTYYAEFPTLAAAKHFITTQDCSLSLGPGSPDPNQIAKTCHERGTAYHVVPFGNNAGAIDGIKHELWKYGRLAVLGITAIAVLIMTGTLGKIIADNRRETAVFRALGATRFHISQIYLTYALLIGLGIIIISFGAGALGAAVLNSHLAPRLSLAAVIIFNAADVHKQFSLFHVEAAYLAMIAAGIVLTSLLAAILPLLLNMRRNPIRDMRDE